MLTQPSRMNWREPLSRLWRGLPRDYVSLGLLALTAVFLGFDLQSRPIVLWDESRVVSNAVEMSRTGFSLVTTYDFKPDLWNTKPPLVIWIVAASIRLFGASEWAVRLPSFVAAIATAAITMKMTWWLTRKKWLACVAVAVLVLSPGFYGAHAAQSADYDTILGLFASSYLFCFFYVIHHQHTRIVWVLLFGLFVVLACLTKGVAGLIPGIGIPFYLIAQKRWPRVLSGLFFATAAGAIFLIGAYYYFREQLNPGYVAAVQSSELGGRFVVGYNSHNWPAYYYGKILIMLSISGPILLLSPAIAFTKWPVSRSRAFFVYALVIAFFDVLVLTLSKTKTFWYVIPMYPILSIASALLIGRLWEWHRGRSQAKPNATKFVVLGALAVLVLTGCEIYSKAVTLPAFEYRPQGQYGRLFAALSVQKISKVTVLDAGVQNADGLINYSPQLHFYSVAWTGRGLSAEILHTVEPDKIPPGSVVATCDPSLMGKVQALGPPIARVRDCAAVIDRPMKAG